MAKLQACCPLLFIFFIPTHYRSITLLKEQGNNIARKVKLGDERAFEQVFRAHYADMRDYASKYLADSDQAEEIVQEMFVNYWSKKSSIEIEGSLEAYLFRAVRNLCLNHLKYTRVRSKYVLAQARPLKEEENRNIDMVVVLELQQKIDEGIDQLPPGRQKIFKLNRFKGLKYREIADELGLSVKTVEAQMGKALKFLRENLSEYAEDDVKSGSRILSSNVSRTAKRIIAE